MRALWEPAFRPSRGPGRGVRYMGARVRRSDGLGISGRRRDNRGCMRRDVWVRVSVLLRGPMPHGGGVFPSPRRAGEVGVLPFAPDLDRRHIEEGMHAG